MATSEVNQNRKINIPFGKLFEKKTWKKLDHKKGVIVMMISMQIFFEVLFINYYKKQLFMSF